MFLNIILNQKHINLVGTCKYVQLYQLHITLCLQFLIIHSKLSYGA